MTGRHSRGEDYARVLCCCGYRIVSMTWDEHRTPSRRHRPLPPHPTVTDPNE